MIDLKNKVVVIAGATGGVGRALVASLAKKNATLVLLGRSQEKLDTILDTLKGEGHKRCVVDFSQEKSIQGVAEAILKDFSQIDVLINTAGYGVYKPIEEVAFKEWDDSFAIGVTAPYFLTKFLLPAITKSDISLIVNMGSGAGVFPMAGRSVYNIQKYALRGMTLSLALEFERTNTHFCLMTMGSILTEFGPMTLDEKKQEMESGKAYFTPEWVAEKITDIIQDENRKTEYELYPSNYEVDSGKQDIT